MTTRQNAVIDSSKRSVPDNVTGGHRCEIHLTLRRILNRSLPYYKSHSLENIVKVAPLGFSGSLRRQADLVVVIGPNFDSALHLVAKGFASLRLHRGADAIRPGQTRLISSSLLTRAP